MLVVLVVLSPRVPVTSCAALGFALCCRRVLSLFESRVFESWVFGSRVFELNRVVVSWSR